MRKLFRFFRRRTVQVIAMRATEVTSAHPQIDFSHACDKCGQPVGLDPSSQYVLAHYGRKRVVLVCNHCHDLFLARSAPVRQ
jgi:hypothetical protein